MPIKLSGFVASFFLASSLAAWAQTDNGDALKLLDEVTKRYADASSYHIESVRESRDSSALQSSWRKEMLRAEQAPGNRYRFEGQSFLGSEIVVSDGITEWNLRRTDEQYTKRPPGTFGHPFPLVIMADEASARDAFLSRTGLAMAGDFAKSAHFLPEETIPIADRPIACLVVTFGPDDLRKPFPSASTTQTFWIDKERRVIVKSLRVSDSTRLADQTRPPVHPIPIHTEEMTIYPVVELNGPVPDTDFVFTPPADGSLVDEFPTPRRVSSAADLAASSPNQQEMTGKPAPALTLHAADNSSLQLSSLRGHPVLLDLWATWCAPCLEEMPLIDRIFRSTRDQGLVVLGLDSDQDPKTAVDFMKRKNYGWADYHDDLKGRELPHNGIPLLVLIDAEGKIVYYYNGDNDEHGLVSALRLLGPVFATALGDDFK
jgi:cytochrome c biogenesis protein CcmG, thiol:disulfide interchange protein DsbE